MREKVWASVIIAIVLLMPMSLSAGEPTYVMQPGEGYWVQVPADAVWVIDW